VAGRPSGSGRIVDVPPEVRQKAESLGAAGARWLARLPDMIGELESDWQIVVGATLRGGSDSYVAEAMTNAVEPAVIKVGLPSDGESHEIETLVRASGRGYVRLLRHDANRQAILQERLGESLDQLNLPVQSQVEAICETLHSAWTVPPDPGFLSGAEQAHALAEFISATWEALSRPCSQRVIELAVSYAQSRVAAFDPNQAVLVHGDAHASNTLQVRTRSASGGERFRFVDPDGLFAEPACDLAVPMRGWSQELLAGNTSSLGQRRCALLSDLTGVEAQPIWEWGFIERVSTGLLALRVGRTDLGDEMLAVAERFATANPGSEL
jgi:streptomycin 6-kinase